MSDKRTKIVFVLPPNALTRASTTATTAANAPRARYRPPLGQMIFGNAHGKFELGADERYVAEKLYELSKTLGKKTPDAQAHGLLGSEWGYGQEFKNEIFETHPYWWGDCTCGFEEKDVSWSKKRPHTRTCFFTRYQVKNEDVSRKEIPFDKKHKLMTKWAKANGYADAPNGMAVYCDCGVDRAYTIWRKRNNHTFDCRVVAPNFKCGDLEIRWYKYIGRGMSVNREITREELRQIFSRCRRSIK